MQMAKLLPISLVLACNLYAQNSHTVLSRAFKQEQDFRLAL
jgi:hypothetical protein